jgi:hypothetical protein
MMLALGFPAAATSQQLTAPTLVPRDSIITVAFDVMSQYHTPARLVITDSTLYALVWARLTGGDAPPPRVDFSRYQLVLAAYGPTPNLDTQILIDTVETNGVVHVWSVRLGNCLVASAYGAPIHLVRLPLAVQITRFDDRVRLATNCTFAVDRRTQLNWLRPTAPPS